jgi:hypothetical protein
MKKQKVIRLPIICDAGGDLSKNWFVEFYFRNPKNGKFERQKIYKGINIYHTNFERRKAATEICNCYTDKIRNGWSPYIDNNVIYSDNLQFQTHIKNYRNAL